MTSTALHAHDQAIIVRDLLISLGAGKRANPSGNSSSGTTGTASNWPIFVTNMPTNPDKCIAVFNTEGVKQGRNQVDGKIIKHPGFQIRIRTNTDYDAGSLKGRHIATLLSENVARKTVTINASNYLLENVTITSGPVDIGRDEDNVKRRLFTINGTLSMYQIQD